MEEALNIPDQPIPASLLTGFLGSGKTTLLRALLVHPGMEETAVVINEFGEIGLDHHLVAKSSEDMVLMNAGCLCCSIRGDLVETLRGLYKKRVRGEVPPFKRLVIETTGLADPAPILHTLMSDPVLMERFRLDGVITTVDAVNGAATLDQQMESVKQAAVADRILLTKCDLADEDQIESLTERLKTLNPAAPLIRVENGEVDPGKLFGCGLYDPATKSLDVQRWLKAEAYEESHGHGHHGHHHHDVNRHDERVRAFCVTYDKPLDWDRLNAWVEMLITLYGAQILRLKGILNIEGETQPLVVHGVQHLFHRPVQLPAWPSEDHRSRLVFIVRDLPQSLFEETLRSFNEESAPGLTDGQA
ncbi:CobW family GTP-binding protein [Limibacillus halophilus]